MKKLLVVISIHLALGITLMRGTGVLAPSGVELPQIYSGKELLALEATFSEMGSSSAPSVPHKWKIIAARGAVAMIETSFADFELTQIGTPTQTALPTFTFTPPAEPEPTDTATATWEPVLTEIPPTPMFTSTPTFALEPAGPDTPVSSPTSADIAMPPSAEKEISTATLGPTGTATPTAWATWTATLTGVATSMATPTAGIESAFSYALLDRLAKNKPSIWGNKGFYVLLGVLYLTLFGLFLRQILDTPKHRP